MNQIELNDYFRTVWKPNLDQYIYSGYSLIDKVKDHEWVLDVGCGINPFKGKIKNLIGIDPVTDQSDVKTTIEEYQTDQRFDVAFCLGSINFGSHDNIVRQIAHLDQLLTPHARIYWRCNPGRKDHGNSQCELIDFFPWSKKKHFELSAQFGYILTDFKWDTNNRMFAEWIKNI